MVTEGKTFVDAAEAAWYEEKVREVLKDSEVVDEIFRYFGADQALDFSSQSSLTTEFSKPQLAYEIKRTEEGKSCCSDQTAFGQFTLFAVTTRTTA